jgi:hypothetical protein
MCAGLNTLFPRGIGVTEGQICLNYGKCGAAIKAAALFAYIDRMSIALAILLRYTNRDPYAGSLYEPRILVRAEQRDAAGHLAEPRAAGENSPTFQDFI